MRGKSRPWVGGGLQEPSQRPDSPQNPEVALLPLGKQHPRVQPGPAQEGSTDQRVAGRAPAAQRLPPTPPHPSPSSQGHPGPAGPVAAGWPYLRPQLEVTVASPCTATPRSTDPLLFQSWGALESPHCSPCFWAAKAPQPRGRGSGAGKPASAPQASIFFGKSIYVQTSSLSQDSVVSAASLHWTRRLRKLKRRVSAAPSRGPGSCHQSRCELPSFTGGYTDPKLGNMSERGKSRLS